jgi:ATP-dependent helicase HrpB
LIKRIGWLLLGAILILSEWLVMVSDQIFAGLPIGEVLPALRQVLDSHRGAVLQAPPGAGKTTAVPLALLDQPWLAGQSILMLEPRRLAARASAARMADMLGEAVGETVGYRVRQESQVSARTRIEVVTEGILTRRLQSDPELSGVGLVIFDEFHERSLIADTGLALTLEVQGALRDDLRLLVMSATLDGDSVAALMGGVPLVTSQGRMFPVETHYLGSPQAVRGGAGRPDQLLAASVAEAIEKALREETGSVLVFLPGEREIRRVQSMVEGQGVAQDVDIYPLFGALPPAAQDRAIQPASAGRRKVVLSTAIAETSLTIDGVRVVIDAGQARRPRFDPGSGMSRLVTTRLSRAEADQRRGRAGRRQPGVCYRLWSEAEDRALIPFPAPEICEADLSSLALDLAAWGAEAADLSWLDAPPVGAMAQAQDLLRHLGALDGRGSLTAHGQKMAALPLHPRLAHMILAAQPLGLAGLACDLAALLSERDILRASRAADMRQRLRALQQGKADTLHPGAVARVRQLAKDWRRRLGGDKGGGGSVEDCGRLLALAYPDRIALRRASGSYVLSGGRGAVLSEGDELTRFDLLAVADIDGGGANGRIFRAAPLALSDLEDLFAEQITSQEVVIWSSRDDAVLARKQRRLGALVLKDEPLPSVDPARLAEGLAAGIRQTGLHVLPWDKATQQFRARVGFLRASGDLGWPDLSDAALLESLEDWLAPYLSGLSRLAQVKKVPLLDALRALLPWELSQRLDAEAPTHFTIPTGDRIPLDYSSGEVPVLAVRLQQMFGSKDHPSIAGGRVALVVHLLSPAQRPVQITRDLPGFWTSSYGAVKAELKGRYPKHPWPDDPGNAPPTNRIKPRGQ